jgi:23S rRNA (pseudouridine1915-N3)-methyltransferase
MKIKILTIGKSDPNFIKEGIAFFQNKIKHFCDFEWVELVPKKKSENADLAKKIDAELLLSHIEISDYVILLDERGKSFKSSYDFSEFINKKQISGVKRIIFIIGGSHGFDESIYSRANEKISMATMTFSHQMIRLIFLEQLYRGYAILNNLPYHHV